MNNIRVPSKLYTETDHLLGAMNKIVEKIGSFEKSTDEIVQLLPQTLKESPAFKDALTGIWRYDFGDPYIRNGKEIFGTDQCPPVEWLYLSICLMEKIMTRSQFSGFLQRLGDSSKHLEALIECSPLLVLNHPVDVKYEVVGMGQGNKSIDFYITTSESPPVLIDVKCRIRELIRKLPLNAKPEPSGLFKSLPEKFNPQDPEHCLQGGWIYSILMYDQDELHAEFDKTDASRLHFAILACWNKKAYVLSRTLEIDHHIRCIFNLPSDDSMII
jgi:hypothetical protein